MWRRLGTWARRTLSTFRATLYSISDPRLAELFHYGPVNSSGQTVNEATALGISAVWRAVAVVSGTVAQLPLRTVREVTPGVYQRTSSFLDKPGGQYGPTAFEWKETVLAHLLLHGNAFLAHMYGGAGQLLALVALHPLAVSIVLPHPDDPVQPLGGKWFDAHLIDGTTERFDAATMTHIPGLSLDGIRGISVVEYARNSLGTAIAGDQAAAALYGSGLTVAGLITPDEEDPDWEDASFIKSEVNQALTGNANMGKIAILPRKLKFQQMSMSAEDIQFLQSRQFSVEEVARWFGVPPHLLMQTDKQTSWGAGVEAQNRALGRTVLAPWATRIEQRLSRLLPNPRFVEFDFTSLERPDPATEITLLLAQTGNKPILTQNEARAIRNLPPVPGGDVLVEGAQPEETPAEQATNDPQEEASADAS